MGLTIAAMPAYNEERSIAKMVLSCKKYVDEVVVVDDGSIDSTAEIAYSVGAYVVQHKKNGGYGAALQTCFKTARDLDADRMVIIDSDGQHDPAEIPKLLEPLDGGVDLVIGSRFLNGDGQDVPAYRKVGLKVLNAATNVVGSINVTDSQSGFRAYGKQAIHCINVDDNGMSAGSEILLQAKDNKLAIEEVEIHCNYNVERPSTENPVSHGVKVLLTVLLQDMELRKPLHYFTLPGMVIGGIGIWIGLEILRNFYNGGSLNYGLTLLMIFLTLFGSFMVFTGIILRAIPKSIDQSMMRISSSMQGAAESINSGRVRSLYYLTLPGMVIGGAGTMVGLEILQNFYNGGPLNYGLTFLMIFLTLLGSFMGFTGIILHAIPKSIDQSMKRISNSMHRYAKPFNSVRMMHENPVVLGYDQR